MKLYLTILLLIYTTIIVADEKETYKSIADLLRQIIAENNDHNIHDNNNDNNNDNNKCGLKHSRRIVGGRQSQPGDWPWIAAIMMTTDKRNPSHKPYCAGTLVSRRHIVTAAHCLTVVGKRQRWPRPRITVRLGAHRFRSANTTSTTRLPARDYQIKSYAIHPAYRSTKSGDDIAVLTLLTPVKYTSYIQPICLPPPPAPLTAPSGNQSLRHDYSGQSVTVAGWGHTRHRGSVNAYLKQVSLSVWNRRLCEHRYTSRVEDMSRLPETVICAGSRGRHTCQGDSGGPLMAAMTADGGGSGGGGQKRWTLIGVVSGGVLCGDADIPALFTDVQLYANWIGKQICAC
ncbi:CLIP domain-containing serine protease B9-like [Oppia nitens]|uniref:CLIP domain-containing serine protease B9-like n=1 Tax=Oppia nitens TaxID=1686743 RepID=UPI0023DB76B4|nr:CLIP domain-containing serine protease B9-like [Oppia nitens]